MDLCLCMGDEGSVSSSLSSTAFGVCVSVGLALLGAKQCTHASLLPQKGVRVDVRAY
jgi:hypothetical protein